MEIEIYWSTLARQQLKEIGLYVEQHFGERIAIKSLSRISEKVEKLYLFPECGIYDKKYSTELYTVRHLLLTPNIVYYIQAGNKITIMAVVHDRQSPKTISDMIYQFVEHHL